MNHGLKMSVRTQLVLGALALAVAGVSHAARAPTLVGGGATLPSIGYVGSAAATSLQVDPAGTGSLFGVYTAQGAKFPDVSYCLTGSGAGKDILAGVTIGSTEYNVQNSCTKNSSGTVTGFGASAAGRSALTQPNFAGADSPLASTDYTNYVNNHSSGDYPTQFPAVAGAIAIAFDLTDSQGNQVTSSEVNFSSTQVCEIFSGEVTNWDDTRLTSAFTLPNGDSIPSTNINVQYRSDGSGTSFSFSNYLSNVCGEINSAYFQTNQAFTSVVLGNPPSVPGVLSAIPSNWTGSSGNESIATAIGSADGNVGYVETANALATDPSLQYADVSGLSPTANFGSTLTLNSDDVVYNEAITGANSTGQATYGAISGAPSTECIALVPPSAYAPGGDIVPSTTYPIVAISYLLGNTDGNGSDLANTQGLLTAPYTSSITSSVTTIGAGTGLAFLNVSAAFTASQVSGCLVN
jgi:phosphate transport system substrate-binding protein